MKTTREDCWCPCPGSWEEAVDPYDVQRAQRTIVEEQETDRPVMETMRDPQTSPLYTSSV